MSFGSFRSIAYRSAHPLPIVTLTTSGLYTEQDSRSLVPPTAKFGYFCFIGAGGAGGGTAARGASAAGGAGGGIAYSNSNKALSINPTSFTISVGIGGSGVRSASGNAGSSSYFNSNLITNKPVAPGGNGGSNSSGIQSNGGDPGFIDGFATLIGGAGGAGVSGSSVSGVSPGTGYSALTIFKGIVLIERVGGGGSGATGLASGGIGINGGGTGGAANANGTNGGLGTGGGGGGGGEGPISATKGGNGADGRVIMQLYC